MFETIDEYIGFYESMTAPEYVRLQSLLEGPLFEEGNVDDYENVMKLAVGQALYQIYKGIITLEDFSKSYGESKSLCDEIDDDVIKLSLDAYEKVFSMLNETFIK